ncbi:unnamed protein product, partial [Tetraodon nigroviridis]
GEPVKCTAWLGQCVLYILIMMFEKVVIMLVLLIPEWKKLALLNPIQNPDLELAIVMLIVPFFVNVSLPSVLFFFQCTLCLQTHRTTIVLVYN